MLSHSAYFDNGHKLFFLTKLNDYVDIIKFKNNRNGKLTFLGHLSYLLLIAVSWRPSSCVKVSSNPKKLRYKQLEFLHQRYQ